MLIPGVSSTGFPSNANFGSYLLYLLLPSSFFFVRLTSSALKLLKNVSVFFFSFFFIFKSDRLVIEAGSCFCTTLLLRENLALTSRPDKPALELARSPARSFVFLSA